MNNIIKIMTEYDSLVENIKKDFKGIYNSRDNVYEILNKSTSYLEEKLTDLKELKGRFSKQKEKFELETLGLEGEIEIHKKYGETNQLKNDVVNIRKFYLDIYREIEKNSGSFIDYFNTSLNEMKKILNNGEIKNALVYLDEINEVLK